MYRREFLALGLALPFAGTLAAAARPATTWFPKDFDCPVCTTKNTYMVVGSWGSYIYGWPSKYQLIYWPSTDTPTVYCCKKCHLSVFMWDHDELPKEKIPAIKEALKGVDPPKEFEEYTEVKTARRLEIAEKVYAKLEKDDEFWGRFNRIKGYHYQEIKEMERATESRKEALKIAERMIGNKDWSVTEKELWLIVGAMRHFTKDDTGAVEAFNKALSTRFVSDEYDEEEISNGESNLNRMATDYINRVSGGDLPRDGDQ